MNLTAAMRDFILHWGEMGARWGVNRTVAQIHALLYLSDRPLAAEEMAEALARLKAERFEAHQTKDLAKYGLDKPEWQQFLIYVWGAVHFDFGDSLRSPGQQVSTLLIESWPYTFTLGAVTFILLVPIGIGLGVIAAMRQNSVTDYAALGLATVAASTPNFVLGIFLIIVFAIGLNRLTGGNFYLLTGGMPQPWNPFQSQLIMPVITLGALPTAYIARLTRSSTLETLRQDFVRTAWAKGLKGRLVVTRHVLKNSLIPVVTALGPTFAFLVTGSFIVETLFQIPGIGRSFVTSIAARDYTMILGTTLLFAFMIALVNLIVDILYVFLDPRVRLTD